ncbi:NAD(+) diphosphatase [Oceanospirillum maris]|uniref:NAD(+) diphosphatase n=1 Tax=Oceanospirillum maris TaxID=64977 RepID=UPI0003FF6068|nr:NAD(+) diphosphatase [Oceanospirillum maris]
MPVERFCPTKELPANSLLILFVGNDLITDDEQEPLHTAQSLAEFWHKEQILPELEWRFVAHRDNCPVYSARNYEWQDWPERFPDDFQLIDFRALLPALDQQDFELIASASQLLTWDSDHNYCSRCGTKTRIHVSENAMCCDSCGYRQYPRINPCIIALITRGDEVLLARNANFKAGYFSCVAGFIEPGESAEQAVHREIKEEVGVNVKNIRYQSSQSWPFPHSLMLGFICDYDSGDIEVDGHEIVEARWGTLESFPLKPGRFAISGQLMAAFEDSL